MRPTRAHRRERSRRRRHWIRRRRLNARRRGDRWGSGLRSGLREGWRQQPPAPAGHAALPHRAAVAGAGRDGEVAVARRNGGLAVGVVAPTLQPARSAHPAAVPGTGADVDELTGRRVALAVAVGAPAGDCAALADGAGVACAHADFRECSCRGIQASDAVGAPALQLAALAHAAAVQEARADLRECAVRRIRLAAVADAAPVPGGPPALGCAILSQPAGVVRAGADPGEDAGGRGSFRAPADDRSADSDRARMPIADADRCKAALGNRGPTESLGVAPAVEGARIPQRAAVFAPRADLRVAARRCVYLPGITLRVGDGQNGERDQNSKRERRKEGCTPPPPANRRTPPTRESRVGAPRRSGGQIGSARDKLYTIAPTAVPALALLRHTRATPIPSYPRLPRVSRREQHRRPFPRSVAPDLIWGPNPTLCAAPGAGVAR